MADGAAIGRDSSGNRDLRRLHVRHLPVLPVSSGTSVYDRRRPWRLRDITPSNRRRNNRACPSPIDALGAWDRAPFERREFGGWLGEISRRESRERSRGRSDRRAVNWDRRLADGRGHR